MTYREKMQLRELERLLPMLKKTLKKYQEARRLQDVLKNYNYSEKEVQECEKEIAKLADEYGVERKYYENVGGFLKGMKIRRRQVSWREFEALLFFMLVTGIRKEELFENFGEMYPWIVSMFEREYCWHFD